MKLYLTRTVLVSKKKIPIQKDKLCRYGKIQDNYMENIFVYSFGPILFERDSFIQHFYAPSMLYRCTTKREMQTSTQLSYRITYLSTQDIQKYRLVNSALISISIFILSQNTKMKKIRSGSKIYVSKWQDENKSRIFF